MCVIQELFRLLDPYTDPQALFPDVEPEQPTMAVTRLATLAAQVTAVVLAI